MTRGGIGNDIGRAIDKDQPGPGHKAQAMTLRRVTQRGPGPHHTRHAVAIGNADRVEAKRYGLCNHIGRQRCPAQEGIAGGRNQLCKSGLAHAKSPCRYQSGDGASLP